MEFNRQLQGQLQGQLQEIALPDGCAFFDKDGHERRNVRIRWWDEEGSSYQDMALMPEKLRSTLPDRAVPTVNRPVYDQTKPVFFGHYWMQGNPTLQSPRMACVDYSAGKGGAAGGLPVGGRASP